MLTPKQQRFVDEYLIDLNATQAAVRAGYSERTANQQGPRLLENGDISAAIDAAKVERSNFTGTDAEWVLRRLVAEAEADLADIYNENGSIKPLHEWPPIWRQGLVAGIKHQELRDSDGNRTGEFVVDIKISDRVRRLELIGKHIRVNAFQEQVAVSGLDGLADRIRRACRNSDGDAPRQHSQLPPAAEAPIEPTARPAPSPNGPRPHLSRPDHPPAIADDWSEPAKPAAPAGYRPVLPLKPASK